MNAQTLCHRYDTSQPYKYHVEDNILSDYHGICRIWDHLPHCIHPDYVGQVLLSSYDGDEMTKEHQRTDPMTFSIPARSVDWSREMMMALLENTCCAVSIL